MDLDDTEYPPIEPRSVSYARYLHYVQKSVHCSQFGATKLNICLFQMPDFNRKLAAVELFVRHDGYRQADSSLLSLERCYR